MGRNADRFGKANKILREEFSLIINKRIPISGCPWRIRKARQCLNGEARRETERSEELVAF